MTRIASTVALAAIASAAPAAAYNASSFQAFLKNAATIETDSQYELVMEWDHDSAKAPSVGKDLQTNAKKAGGACDPDGIDPKTGQPFQASDGISYWMPRFFPTKVSADVTKYTGIKFVSPDWQPCGHKDIVICHGESHYDFHLYYQEENFLQTNAGCSANPKKPNHYIICDDITAQNNKMFKLMGKNVPVSRTSTASSLMPNTKVGDVKPVNYCMDPTSGVPMSGMHYGDKGETLTEWKEPVTIMGTHDCKLSFFEPMISWKWISNRVWDIKGWPKWHSGEIKYNEKEFTALPTEWAVEVSPGCDADSSAVCHIKVTVKGDKCPSSGCAPPVASCSDKINDCLTGTPYVSPFKPSALKGTETDATSPANKEKVSTTKSGCEYGGTTHCFDPETGKTIFNDGKTGEEKTAAESSAADAGHGEDHEHDHDHAAHGSDSSGARQGASALALLPAVGAALAGLWLLF